jgi:hypothetical protein
MDDLVTREGRLDGSWGVEMGQTEMMNMGSPQARKPSERRTHSRASTALHGRLQARDRHPSHCTVLDISPGGACISTAVIPSLGDQVTVDIACIGRVAGVVVRSDPFDFGLQFTVCDDAKARLADQIAIQFNKSRLGLSERRVAKREPCDGIDPVEFADGSTEEARIKDVSLTGVAFLSENRPRCGEQVRIGVLVGRVARHLDDGFAVAFEPPATPV